MAIITTRKGVEILIDDDDFEWLSKWTWHLDNDGYARRSGYFQENGKRHMPKMHREIMGLTAGDGKFVDHINGNRLDNRRANLRLFTPQQNSMNIGITRRNKSGYKGVSYHKGNRRYRAQINHMGKQRHIGEFQTPEEAAHAYNKAAIALHGDLAILNPVGGQFMSASKEGV